MKWDEFCDLISGLLPETPLGRMVQIRLETDEKVIEKFTPHQKRIWSEWQSRKAKTVTEDQHSQFLESMKQAFLSLAGGAK